MTSLVLTPDDVAAAMRLRNGPAWSKIRAIAEAVSEISGVDPDRVMGGYRGGTTSEARQIVMFAAHKQGVSVADIARALGRDVSTVHHGIEAERKRRGWKA